jgi:hypothetical protein
LHLWSCCSLWFILIAIWSFRGDKKYYKHGRTDLILHWFEDMYISLLNVVFQNGRGSKGVYNFLKPSNNPTDIQFFFNKKMVKTGIQPYKQIFFYKGIQTI